MFNTNCYGNESIPSYTQGVETPWPPHATHSNQNLFHQHGVTSNPNAFVGYGLGQVQSKELDLAGMVGIKETSGATNTPSATTNAWHHTHRMRYSSTTPASRGFLPYQMSSLPHYDSQSVDSSHLTHGTHPQFWMTNPNAYSIMQNYNQRDHNTYAERADTSRSAGAMRHNSTMPNRTYAVEDQSRNVNSTLQQQPAEVLSQHCQRPIRQSTHQLQQHQQVHHQQEYLRNTITQRERDPCQYTNSSYHQESMRVGVETSLYHDQHVMPSTQHQHPQYQASQEALRKAENERRAAFSSRQTWPQTWAKAPTYVPFDSSQAFLPNHRSSGSAFQPCSKQAGTDPYSMDSIWAKSAVPTPSSHVPQVTNHTIPSTNNHIPLPAQTWIHDTTSHLKSNVYRPPQDMNQVTNVPSNFSTNVLNLDTGQVELSMSVVPPDLSLYSQAVPQTQRHRTSTAVPASVPVQSRHRPTPAPAVPQNHVKHVMKEAPPKPMESAKPTSTARAAGLDVRQFLATWDEDLDIATPRPAMIETDEPEPPEPAPHSLVVLDYHTVPSEEAAGLLQLYPDLQLSGNDPVVLLDGTSTKTNLDFVLSQAVPTTTSSEFVSAPANSAQVSQSSGAIDVAPASGKTAVTSTSDQEKLLNSNHLEASLCNVNESSNVEENRVDVSSEPRSQEALTPVSVCESDSEKQKKTSLRLFRKRKAAESDASSQCSEHAGEVPAKCMKSDNNLSNWFGNDSMDTIDGPIRTPVSVSSAAYDPSSSAGQSPIDSMGVMEEKSAEGSTIPESTAVSVITMNRCAKDRIGRSMPDIFDEVMYEIDQATSNSVETERRRPGDDSEMIKKFEVVTNIVESQYSKERGRDSPEKSGGNAVDEDRSSCDNTNRELSDNIKKNSPEVQTKSPVAEHEFKEDQQRSEMSVEKHGTNSSPTLNKTDLETIFPDQEDLQEFSKNNDQEISKKFDIGSGDNKDEKTCERTQYSDKVPSNQVKLSNNSEPVTTDTQERLINLDNGIAGRNSTDFENQGPLNFGDRDLCNLINSEQSKTTTAQISGSPNEGLWDVSRDTHGHNTGKPAYISGLEENTNGDCAKIGEICLNCPKTDTLVDLSNAGDFVDHGRADFAHPVSSDFSREKTGRRDFMGGEPNDLTRQELSDSTSREPSDIKNRDLSDITSQAFSDITSEETSDNTSEETSDNTSEETSDNTSEETSDNTSEETSDITSEEPSVVTSEEPSVNTSEEPSAITRGEPSDVTRGDPSDVTSREPSDVTSGEPSDVTSGEPSDVTSGDPSDVTSGEPSDVTNGEPSYTSGEPSDTTSEEPINFTSQEARQVTSQAPREIISRDFCDSKDWNPAPINPGNIHAPISSGKRSPTDLESRDPTHSGNQERIKSEDVEKIISDNRELSKSNHLETIESGSVLSRDSFKNWMAIDCHSLDTTERSEEEPNDTVNFGRGNLVTDRTGKVGIGNSMASYAHVSFDPVSREPVGITPQDVQNSASNANIEPWYDSPRSFDVTNSGKQESEKEVVPVCRNASSKLSTGSPPKTTQYLSRIVGFAPGKIPKILLSRLKNVRDKKRKNGIVQKLPCIRLTRVQTGTSLNEGEPPEYVCKERDSRSEDLDDRLSVREPPDHEVRVIEVQKADSFVGQSLLENEPVCREGSNRKDKNKGGGPTSFKPGGIRETTALPSPERATPSEQLEDVREQLRADDVSAPRSEDSTTAVTSSSEPSCLDLTVNQTFELPDEDAITRPTTPVSPFEKKMSSGQVFRNKSPDGAERPNLTFFQRRPVRRRYDPKRRFSLPSPKSFEEDAALDSPLDINYQTKNEVLMTAFKYTLVPVRLRSISADAVVSKINEMPVEITGDIDRVTDKQVRRVQENLEKISSAWEEDSHDMIVSELCENFLEVREEADKIQSVYKSPVRCSNDTFIEKDLARHNSDNSASFRKDSPAGFDSPWKDSRRDSPTSDKEDTNDTSDTSSSSSSKTSRRTSSSKSDSSDSSDASSGESSDDEKCIASPNEHTCVRNAGRDDSVSSENEVNSSAKEDNRNTGTEGIADTWREDAASLQKEDVASAEKEDVASAEEEDFSSAEKGDVANTEKENVASAKKDDVANAEKDVASAEKDDVASAEKDDVASAEKDDVASAEKDDVASAEKDNVTSADKEDGQNEKLNNLAPAADEFIEHQAKTSDAFTFKTRFQVEGGCLPEPFSEDVKISSCSIQQSGHCSAPDDGGQVLQNAESLSACTISRPHSIELEMDTNAEDYGVRDLPVVSDCSNGHAVKERVSKELAPFKTASLVSATSQEDAIADNVSRVGDTCPLLEAIKPEQPTPNSGSMVMPCLEKIVEPEDISDHNVKTDLPKISNHIDGIDGTDVLIDEDTLLVLSDDVENVFVGGEDGCLQIEVLGENSEFHPAVRDENIREFNVQVQGENAVGFPLEVQEENAGKVSVGVQDEYAESPAEIQDRNAEEFPFEVQDGKTQEYHIVVDEEQYKGLCNGTMEVFTSDAMKTFTVENIRKGELHCEETEHADQGDFYCDEIGAAPVEEVVNSETACDPEGVKVYSSWRDESIPLEAVDNESLVGADLSEKEETSSSCNEIPLEMKCSLSWDRILNEGQGLVLGPANVEVRVPGETAKEATHWKVVTRERKRPGTSKTRSRFEENNNVMLDVKSPIIVVKRLVLKRPRTRRSQQKRDEDELEDLWKGAAKTLPPLKTKGALKAFQALSEGTHLRNRNRSWPSASGGRTWTRRNSLKRRRINLSPPPRTHGCPSPHRLPKVIIKKTGPQYQSFICDDDVFMQPVVSIERNAELDNLALTMWSEDTSPTSSAGLSPQRDRSNQTKGMETDNVSQVQHGKRKQPKTGRAGQLMKVVELLQQWRQAEQDAAAKVSQDSTQADCDDSIENNNSLMCIDNNADRSRYHLSDSSSSSSCEGSVTNDFSYYRNAVEEDVGGRTKSDNDVGDHLNELIDSLEQKDGMVDKREGPEGNIRDLEDISRQSETREDIADGSTQHEDDISLKDCLEDDLSLENRLEESVVEEIVLEDNIVEESALKRNAVEDDTIAEDVRDDNIILLEDNAVRDFMQVEDTNQQDIDEKQMLDVIAHTDDIMEDAILNDDIVEEVVEDESVEHAVLMENALNENIGKKDLTQNGLVEKIVEDTVHEYDIIRKFRMRTLQESNNVLQESNNVLQESNNVLQESDNILQDKTIQEADSAFEAASSSAQETASALQEEVVVREADSVLQKDVYQLDLQQGVEITCTEKNLEGSALSLEQSRRTSVEEELGLPLVCQVCGFTTIRLEEQANHIRTHSYHCQRCQLAFLSQEDFKDHLAAEHPTVEELHHCLLCQRTFPTAERHAQHKQGWHHSQMERSQRHTIHSLFRFFTGNDCPYLPSLAPEEVKAFDWLPSDPGVIHFYHDATPLQLAVQDCEGAKYDAEIC